MTRTLAQLFPVVSDSEYQFGNLILPKGILSISIRTPSGAWKLTNWELGLYMVLSY